MTKQELTDAMNAGMREHGPQFALTLVEAFLVGATVAFIKVADYQGLRLASLAVAHTKDAREATKEVEDYLDAQDKKN